MEEKSCRLYPFTLTLLHSELPKLHRVLVILSALGLICPFIFQVAMDMPYFPSDNV